MWRHGWRWAALGLVTFGAVGFAGPALAATDVRVVTSGYTALPVAVELYGVDATVYAPAGTQLEIIVDWSSIDSRIEVEPSGSNCQLEGRRARCHGESGPEHHYWQNLSLHAAATMPPGPAGAIVVSAVEVGATDPNPANNSGRIPLDVVNDDGSRIDVTVKWPTGSLGRTITVSVTVRNYGPNALRTFYVGSITEPRGTSFAGYTGCGGVAEMWCATGIVPEGQSRTIGIRFKINSCDGSGGLFPTSYKAGTLPEKWFRSYSFDLTITGCTPTNPEPSADVLTTGQPSDMEPSSAATTSTPMARPTDSGTALPLPVDTPRIDQVAAPAGGRSFAFGAAAVTMLLLLAGIVVMLMLRQRRAGIAEGPGDSSLGEDQ